MSKRVSEFDRPEGPVWCYLVLGKSASFANISSYWARRSEADNFGGPCSIALLVLQIAACPPVAYIVTYDRANYIASTCPRHHNDSVRIAVRTLAFWVSTDELQTRTAPKLTGVCGNGWYHEAGFRPTGDVLGRVSMLCNPLYAITVADIGEVN